MKFFQFLLICQYAYIRRKNVHALLAKYRSSKDIYKVNICDWKEFVFKLVLFPSVPLFDFISNISRIQEDYCNNIV